MIKEINRKKTAAIINLGCKVNKYEADAMKDRFVHAGYQIVEPEDYADVYVVNTCSVTNMAQKKSRQMLRRAKKQNPEAVIVAAGCYVNAEHDKLKQEVFIDVIVGNNRKKDIVSIVEEYQDNRLSDDYYIDINQCIEYEEMGNLDVANMDHQRAYIKIQDGCNQFCSYCIIPYTRGRVRSRSATHILSEIRQLAAEGVKEFVLTGIHISSYGIDLRGGSKQYDEVMDAKAGMMNEAEAMQDVGASLEIVDLPDLVDAISQIEKVRRIRLGSLEPRIITDDFLERLCRNDKFCPHFHLSLQSACNETLKRMNRKYTIEEFMDKCMRIRAFFDVPAITTDVIVGFPGETEEEFATTLENLKKLDLYEIHVFKYSMREGTVAQKLPNQVPEEIKTKRSNILLQLTERQKYVYEHAMQGFVEEVLIEERLEKISQEDPLTEVFIVNQEETEEHLGIFREKIHYFTGHTKRYVKVKVLAKDDMVNEIVKVQFI